MAEPNAEPPAKAKPVKTDIQVLRQQQVAQMQKERAQAIQQSDLPTAMPIQDKYIFGLAKPGSDTAESSDAKVDATAVDDTSDSTSSRSKYTPRKYSDIWDKQEFITSANGATFCCYSAGITNNNLVFVCLHGCGHCALSYSLVAQALKDKYQVFAFDYRGHGHTTFPSSNNDTSDDSNTTTTTAMPSMQEYYATHFTNMKGAKKTVSEEYKMSKDNLVRDIIDIVHKKYGTEDPPPIVLVGHSLGGALAVHTAHVKQQGIASLVGIVVIDLVEGTALNSLIHMRSIINRRPTSFDSIESAIRWCVTSGMIRNYRSGQYSLEAMFVKRENGTYGWRTDVLLTEAYWKDWFVGLSALFLTSPCAKMLMLADTDRLDKPLTIGQMQGKYELCIVGSGVGHTLHEDAPRKVADKLLHFVERNQFIKMWQMNKKLKLKKK